jgi:hypothetical protein
MRINRRTILAFAGIGLLLLGINGCSSPGYPTSSSSSVGYSYGSGFYDPWYGRPYGYPYYGGGTVIINPPSHRPPPDRPVTLPAIPPGPRPIPRR